MSLWEEMLFHHSADIVINREMKLLYLIGLALGNAYTYIGKVCQSTTRLARESDNADAESLRHRNGVEYVSRIS